MCESCAPVEGWTRRRLLTAGLGGVAAAAVPVRVESRTRTVEVMPREAWATGGREPTGALAGEPDVRFLLVHHTVNSNTYAQSDVGALLRSIFDFHTGSEKGWPDIAYNFLVDRFGGVWEARAGSLAGAVAGDATGGNQGFDQKCAFLGDHSTSAPTPEATAAMADLLAFLADRHGIDTAPQASTSFVSRGSNKHRSGATVTTATIAGHRTMSATSCPGDAGYRVVSQELPAAVTSRRSGTPSTTTTTTTTAAPTTTVAPATTASTATVPAPVTTVAATSTTAVALRGEPSGDSRLDGAVLAAAGSAVVAAGGALLVFLRTRGGGPRRR